MDLDCNKISKKYSCSTFEIIKTDLFEKDISNESKPNARDGQGLVNDDKESDIGVDQPIDQHISNENMEENLSNCNRCSNENSLRPHLKKHTHRKRVRKKSMH